MKAIPFPYGWAAMCEHLVEAHGFTRSHVDVMDTDRMWGTHEWAHREGVFKSNDKHRHDG